MSAEVHVLPTYGTAYTPEEVAGELRGLADQIDRGEFDFMRIVMVTEDRGTNRVLVSCIGDRTSRMYANYMLDLGKQLLLDQDSEI